MNANENPKVLLHTKSNTYSNSLINRNGYRLGHAYMNLENYKFC